MKIQDITEGYGRYYCSTDKKWKTRKGPKQTRKVSEEQGVAEGLPQTLRKVVPGYAKREIDKKMDDQKFGRTDVDRDANYHRYKKIQDKIKNKGVAEGLEQVYNIVAVDKGNAMARPKKLTYKAGSIEEVFDALVANDWYPLEINGVEVINGKHLKQGVAEASGFDKWADDRAASQLHKLKPATAWEVSYDYGPHMTKSVTVNARSEEEARAKVEKAAEKKGMSIMINSVEQQGVAEEKQRLDPKCWDGYKKQGTKMKGGVRVNNCVKEELEETYDGDEFFEAYGELWYNEDEQLDEAEYQGRSVPLGKPMQGDVKKFKVYVKDPSTGNVKKVNFGDPDMKIRKSNPAARRSFRARHNCDNPGPRTKARYWSCRKW